LEAELKEKFTANIRLIPSSGGVFEVEADGNLLFSKKRLGRFPEEGEITGLVQEMVGRNS